MVPNSLDIAALAFSEDSIIPSNATPRAVISSSVGLAIILPSITNDLDSISAAFATAVIIKECIACIRSITKALAAASKAARSTTAPALVLSIAFSIPVSTFIVPVMNGPITLKAVISTLKK